MPSDIKYRDIKGLVAKDTDPAKHRHPGGKRMYITRGEKTSRRMWQKVGQKKSSLAGRYLAELTPLEQLVDEINESISYETLWPVCSSFALVEEAAALYKGDPRDPKYKSNVKVPFSDINNAGMSRSGVGRTLRRPYHGWTCTCWLCTTGDPDK